MIKPKINNRKIVLYIAGLLVVVLLAFQALIDLSVYRSVIQVRPDNGTVLATLISDAIRQLNKPAPVDPATGKIYIPEARLVLPTYTGLGQIEYQYESGQYTSNHATEIHLTSSTIMNLSENKLWVDLANANNRTAWQRYDGSNSFKSIPSLQACFRGVQLFYSKQDLGDDFIFQGSHVLSNGQTLYLYSESGCKQNQSAVISLAKQAQSY